MWNPTSLRMKAKSQDKDPQVLKFATPFSRQTHSVLSLQLHWSSCFSSVSRANCLRASYSYTLCREDCLVWFSDIYIPTFPGSLQVSAFSEKVFLHNLPSKQMAFLPVLLPSLIRAHYTRLSAYDPSPQPPCTPL